MGDSFFWVIRPTSEVGPFALLLTSVLGNLANTFYFVIIEQSKWKRINLTSAVIAYTFIFVGRTSSLLSSNWIFDKENFALAKTSLPLAFIDLKQLAILINARVIYTANKKGVKRRA